MLRLGDLRSTDLAGVPVWWNLIISPAALCRIRGCLNCWCDVLAREQVTRSRAGALAAFAKLVRPGQSNLAQRIPANEVWSSSGEVLSVELAQALFWPQFPEATLLNICGWPSEVAADVNLVASRV